MANIYGQAAAICGVKGFFAETYEKPELAKSDSKTSLNYNEIESLVKNVDRQLRISRLWEITSIIRKNWSKKTIR